MAAGSLPSQRSALRRLTAIGVGFERIRLGANGRRLGLALELDRLRFGLSLQKPRIGGTGGSGPRGRLLAPGNLCHRINEAILLCCSISRDLTELTLDRKFAI